MCAPKFSGEKSFECRAKKITWQPKPPDRKNWSLKKKKRESLSLSRFRERRWGSGCDWLLGPPFVTSRSITIRRWASVWRDCVEKDYVEKFRVCSQRWLLWFFLSVFCFSSKLGFWFFFCVFIWLVLVTLFET